MTEPIGRWRATYTPGEWVVLAGPTLLVVMPPAPPKHSRLLNDLWEDVLGAKSILDLTRTLGTYRLDTLPHFGVLFWADGQMRSLLRGGVKIHDSETGEKIADGQGVQTWTEIGLKDVHRFHIELQQVPGEVLRLPLVMGAVTASAVQIDASDAAPVVFPVAVAAPEAEHHSESVVPRTPESEPESVDPRTPESESEHHSESVDTWTPEAEPHSESVDPPTPESEQSVEAIEEVPAGDTGPAASQPTGQAPDGDVAATDEGETTDEQVEVPDLDLPATVVADPLATDFDTEYPGSAAGVDSDVNLGAVPAVASAQPVARLGLDADGEEGSSTHEPPESTSQQPAPPGTVAAAGAAGLAAGAVAGTAAGLGVGAPGVPRLPGPASPFPGSGQVPYPAPRSVPQTTPRTGERPPLAPDQRQAGPFAPPPGSGAVPPAVAPGHAGPPAQSPPQWRAVAAPLEAAAPHAGRADAAPREAAPVLAAMCGRQHANPPDARVCARCGAPVDTQSPRWINPPVLAVVKASTGQVAELNSVVLVGRSPTAQESDQDPVLMAVPSPSQDISRTHVRLAAAQWQIVVTDLHSTNGTMLLRQGEAPVRLRPGEPVSVGIGAVLDLGDGVTIWIE